MFDILQTMQEVEMHIFNVKGSINCESIKEDNIGPCAIFYPTLMFEKRKLTAISTFLQYCSNNNTFRIKQK